MASSSGASSGFASSAAPASYSGSDEDLRQVMDQRKRKRMLSNRESARRSRMRKKKQLDDMAAEMGQLREQNSLIVSDLNTTSQLYMKIEAENSVLRAQMSELTHRLESLNEMVNCLSSNSGERTQMIGAADYEDSFLMNPWRTLYMNQQPIINSFMY